MDRVIRSRMDWGEDLWDVRSGGSVTGMERGINSNESVCRDCFEP